MRFLLLCLALVLPIQGQSDHPESRPDKQSAKDAQKPAKKLPAEAPAIGVNVVNQQAPPAEQNGTRNESKNYLSRLFAPENIPNIILVAFAGVGIIVAICTLKEMARQRSVMQGQLDAMNGQITQMKDSGEQTTQLIEQAKAQVKELKDSTDIALTSAENAVLHTKAVLNSERPWLFIEIKTGDAKGVGVPEHLGFSVSFKNWGKTPAEIVIFDQHPDFFDTLDDIPAKPEYSLEGQVWAHTRMVPAGETWRDPGSSYWFAQSFLPQDIWTDIRNSKKRLVYWGRIQYRDLVEDSKSIHELPKIGTIHETCFCYFWSPAMNDFLICGPVSYNRHT